MKKRAKRNPISNYSDYSENLMQPRKRNLHIIKTVLEDVIGLFEERVDDADADACAPGLEPGTR
jgi:hypothetical protein